jgi:hypothetical protein
VPQGNLAIVKKKKSGDRKQETEASSQKKHIFNF